jgi:tripartite-type tricarboxylate transporter receptor subunit TctC
MLNRFIFAATLLCAAPFTALFAAPFAAPAFAQSYPDQPIRLLVSFAPGGGTDLTARIAAEDLSRRFGKPVTVENRPGAQTAVALELTSKAKNDGYTILWTTSDGMGILRALRDNLSFNFEKDFEFVATTMKYSLVLAVNPKLPIKSVSDLIAYGKANPGKLTYATSGISGELAAALILKAVGVQAVQIPYGGSAPAAAAAVNGTTDMVIAAPASTKDHIAAGSLRAIVITDVARNKQFPDVPTLIDAGIPDLKNVSILLYNGVLAPAGTPAPILERWRTELQGMLKDPAVIERLARINYEPAYLGGPEFKASMISDSDRWKEVARANGIKLTD